MLQVGVQRSVVSRELSATSQLFLLVGPSAAVLFVILVARWTVSLVFCAAETRVRSGF